jgi:hypothetical protein
VDKINQWLNQQPYNQTVRVTFTPGIENMKQFYYEQSDTSTRQTINRSVAVANEIARQDFLEQEIAEMHSYDLALELITRAKEKK